MKRLAETTTDPLIREYAVNVVLVSCSMHARRVELARFYAGRVAKIQLTDEQLKEVAAHVA
jgi:hypothetical protein